MVLNQDQRRALADVHRHEIDYYAYGAAQGFAWHSGGALPEWEYLALAALLRLGVIVLIPAMRREQIGCTVAVASRYAGVLT